MLTVQRWAAVLPRATIAWGSLLPCASGTLLRGAAAAQLFNFPTQRFDLAFQFGDLARVRLAAAIRFALCQAIA
jgi:hypothetical protein